MSARNDITGDAIQSKALSKQGRENYDRIFRKPRPVPLTVRPKCHRARSLEDAVKICRKCRQC